MAAYPSFLADLLLLISVSSVQSIAYVRPSSANNVTCPDQPCLTFSDYAREKDHYFLDGTTFVFLPGVHQLDLQLWVENVSNLSLRFFEKDASTQIFLDPKVNITWMDCNNIAIHGLEIFLTGTEDNRLIFSALVFSNTTSLLSQLNFFGDDNLHSTAIRTYLSVVRLSDVIFSGATSLYGAALVVFNSTVNFFGRNYFVNNTASNGGAIVIFDSIVNFHGINLFVSNVASSLKASGGAIITANSIIKFYENVSFINNIASTSSILATAVGGAIYCETSFLSFSGSVLLQQNQAIDINGPGLAQGGGMLAQAGSILIFEESSNVILTHNFAALMAGAIYIMSSELAIHGKALFEENYAKTGAGALMGILNSKIFCNGSGERIIFRNNYIGNATTLSTYGGAISSQSSIVKLEGILFENNVGGDGGAIKSKDFLLHILTCQFRNNTALFDGSAVSFSGGYGIAIFNGTNDFQWNFAVHGSILSVSFTKSDVIFDGENIFLNNYVSRGRGMLIVLAGNAIIHGNLTFYRNHGYLGGGLYGIRANLTVCGNKLFIGNSANQTGGGMTFNQCNINITDQTYLVQNSAGNAGSAVYFHESNVRISGNMNISNNFDFMRHSCVDGSLTFINSTVSVTGMLTLENNTGCAGGAIYMQNSKIYFFGCIQCIKNQGRSRGGAIFAMNSTINFRNNSDCNIFQANFADDKGGAFCTIDSIINLSGSLKFMHNSAEKGGAIEMDGTSKLVLMQPLQASFVENSASVGGVIFYEDAVSASQCAKHIPINSRGTCFIELKSTSNIQLFFINNTAISTGTTFYGGNLDRCRLYVGGGVSDSCGNRIGGNYSDDPIAMIHKVSSSYAIDSTTSNISSDPLQLCFCVNVTLKCSDLEIYTVRGKTFTLMALIIGQNSGVVPSSVRTSLDNNIKISDTQRIQSTGKQCTPVTYRLSSNKSTTKLVLFPDGPCRDTGISRRKITINFLPCPDGFTLEGSECVCEERLQRYTNSCSVDDSSIRRDSNTFWMGSVYDNGTFGGLILHSGCPFDYCVDTPVLIKLDNVDIQCDHNHSGILCGSCTSGYSVVFSTLHCLPCSNAYLTLVLPFILAGFVLVIILLLLKVSVVNGDMNGLIFYANVIQVNRSIFFPPGDTNILTVFIAWLNLDLGIETCFFDGMNTYIFTWLQFVFPLYVWFLIGLIIVLSWFSTKIVRVFGKNPVAVLATLFLLSYSKILRTIIVALSFTILEYPGNTYQAVWLYDGNILYFQSASHIVLGTVAIVVLLVLFLPYTLLLLCGHWLQACSDRWIFSWLNKIMPLMDAYHAPYKKESRYWTGFLLLVRCALFLSFAVNSLSNASGNLLAIVSVTAGLLILSWLRVKIYKNIFNDFLEAAFLLNLCILAAGTYHVKEIGGNQAALAYTSVGIAFVLFICILLYHMYLHLHTTLLWKKTHFQRHYIFNKLRHKEKDTEVNDVNNKTMNEMVQLPTVSIIELDACEPLLA